MSDLSTVSPADDVETPLAPIRPEGFFGGARLMAADARVAYLLLDDARRRAVERLLGIPRDQPSGIETLVAVGLLLSATRSRAQSGRAAIHSHRQLSGTDRAALGFAVVREAAYDVAGPWARESSYFGTLLAFALVGATARLAVRKSAHGVKGLSHQAYAEFHHRYGHLILRNRRRGAGPRESGALPWSDV
jgi:hypothetical protein